MILSSNVLKRWSFEKRLPWKGGIFSRKRCIFPWAENERERKRERERERERERGSFSRNTRKHIFYPTGSKPHLPKRFKDDLIPKKHT